MKPKNTPLATALTSSAALLALQHSADASIIYTSSGAVLHMGTGAVASAFTLSINLNNAGPNDFLLYVASSGSRTGGRAFLKALAPNGALSAPGSAPGSARLKKLAAGAIIGPAAANWAGGYLAMAKTGGGTWTANQTKFAGVRLSVGGGNYDYGWIRMRLDDTNPNDGTFDSLTVIDYAYETGTNVPIAAGAGIPTPEPGTTALLALAGAGAAFLRRRRDGKG